MPAVLVSLTGVAVATVGLFGIAAPTRLADLLARWRFLTRLPMTVVFRIGYGTVFLVGAPYCRLPDVVRLLGVLEFIAAVVLLALGSRQLERFVVWWLEHPPSFVRRWCSGAVAFGLLLVYASSWPAQ